VLLTASTVYLVRHTLNLLNCYRFTHWVKEPSPQSINSNECLNDIYKAVKTKFLLIFYYVFNVSHATVVKLENKREKTWSFSQWKSHLDFFCITSHLRINCFNVNIRVGFKFHSDSHLRWEFFRKGQRPKFFAAENSSDSNLFSFNQKYFSYSQNVSYVREFLW
jgi:hypothetical protein